MTLPVALELFDLLSGYAKDIEAGKIKPGSSLAATSPALTFCENFYVQFFQNELSVKIVAFNSESKKSAVQIRLTMKKKKASTAIIQLITWFEKLCDIYPNVLAIGYGGGGGVAFIDFHQNYLLILLERASAWAKVKKHSDLHKRAAATLLGMRAALKSIPK